MTVLWIGDVRSADIDTVGGKAASLGELTEAGLPVPPGFVVTAETYRTFLETTGIGSEIFDALAVDDDGLAEAAERARELVVETPVPEAVREEILAAYGDLGGLADTEPDDQSEPFVAVRSSATAEDLPDASFAGQYETILNVTEEDLLDRVKECWASLFSERAVHYRNTHGFDHDDVDVAVVVQQMVDADKSGVMFTRHPSTGDRQMIVESAWGLGEAVVSGMVSPDHYEIDPETATIVDSTIADKKQQMIKDPETGETALQPVGDERRTERVVTDAEIERLVELGRRVEDHYGEPQDVEWALVEGELFMLQSRPITTISEAGDSETVQETDATQGGDETAGRPGQTAVDGGGDQQVTEADADSETDDGVLVRGVSASPGTASGEVRLITKLDHLDQVTEGDVLVSTMTTPDMVPAMQRAAAIVTDEGGMTSHSAIVSREMGVPAIVGTRTATDVLKPGQQVTVDGEMGTVTEGGPEEDEAAAEEYDPVESVRPQTPVKPMTATEVKVNLSIPEAAERAAATGADGVGLLRMEHMVISLGKTPEQYIADHGENAFIDELVDGVRTVAEAFYPRPVRARTLDAPTDEFRDLQGGSDEPHEHNPMLGYRGIRRSLDKPAPFRCELRAFKRLFDAGYDNVELMLPLVNDAEDVERAKLLMEEVGIDPAKSRWGVMVETPASALLIEEIAAEGIDFVSFGTNDLTQYTLAVDRNNEHVVDRFDELHPGVLSLIETTIETCRELGVDTSICGQAASKSDMVDFLVEQGISSISANIDAVRDVQHEVKRVEQKLLLDSVR
ncbi:phosphoenolpyruvate synthase [Halohasta litorea]|uniref:phosphoenolpyruvate synthase n=1 Tax=Halohasta litorea TaxID=869891 RepID=UPI002111BA38|nr:phosphoenolpyruvate synthase [Halohasta litorea]